MKLVKIHDGEDTILIKLLLEAMRSDDTKIADYAKLLADRTNVRAEVDP